MVSSDDDRIGAFAAMHGALYHKRSEESCRDDAPIVEAVIEALQQTSYEVDTDCVLVLYPVAPFATVDDITEGMAVLERQRCNVVYPVYKAREHVERVLIRRGDRVLPRYPEYTETNSQYFETTYHSAGQWYLADIAWLLANRTLTPLEAGFVEIPQRRAVDIDTPDDWLIAEMLYVNEHLPGVGKEMTAKVAAAIWEDCDDGK